MTAEKRTYRQVDGPSPDGVRVRIEDTYGWARGMAFVWLSSGDSGYRLSMPVDLARVLCERLGGHDAD